MLDHYIWGKVDRISPEAPVPVVSVGRHEYRLGGAANAALNLVAMGAQVQIMGLVGKDEKGEMLAGLLAEAGITPCLVKTDVRPTTCKSRIMAQGQQLLRYDEEDASFTHLYEAEALIQMLENHRDVDAILFSDYDKGTLSAQVIEAYIAMAQADGIVTTVDPKFRQFDAYEGCTLFKPNLKELQEGMFAQWDGKNHEEVTSAVLELRQKMPHPQTLVTLGAGGMLHVNKAGESLHQAAQLREVTDVSGAGDSVIAAATLALTVGASTSQLVALANRAGAVACGFSGVRPVEKALLLQ